MKTSLFESSLLNSLADNSFLSDHPDPRIRSRTRRDSNYKENPHTNKNQTEANYKIDFNKNRNSFDQYGRRSSGEAQLHFLQKLMEPNSKIDFDKKRGSSYLFQSNSVNTTNLIKRSSNVQKQCSFDKRLDIRSVAAAVVFRPDFSKQSFDGFVQLHPPPPSL